MRNLDRFDWIAPFYDQLVRLVFGQTLHEAQMHFVPKIPSSAAILILGGGTGEFLAALLSTVKNAEVTYIDASSKMIGLAKRRVGGEQRVSFIHGTHENIPDIKYDVVITGFFLDLLSEQAIQALSKSIFIKMKGVGKWIVTDFENTQSAKHRILLRMMYAFFNISGSVDVKRLPEWKPILAKGGFYLADQKVYKDGFIGTSLYQKESIGE